MVQFGSNSGQPMFGQNVPHAKTSNFVKNFGSGMVRFGSIRVSGEHISGVGSGMVSGSSVRVSGLGSVLPGLAGPTTIPRYHW